MVSVGDGLVAVCIAFFVGVSGGFVFSSDPTGALPILIGLASTLVLTPLVYWRLQRD